MEQHSKHYGLLDYFRIFAAILIIAIHTSPLLSVSETGDFIFTKIICRVAVPFFFMVSGYFILPKCLEAKKEGSQTLMRFLKKTGSLYGIAVLLYLPVNVYSGYFKSADLPVKLLRDFVFNGTFYHLWYLPAVLLGMVISYILLKYLKPITAFGISGFLYLIGLLGDSYYGLISGIPLVKGFYQLLFSLFDYTRNGIFFAPLFLIGGYLIAEKVITLPFKHFPFVSSHPVRAAFTGLASSSLLMIAEGFILYYYNVQRHNSMYLFLPFVMLFLFLLLIAVPVKGSAELRKTSMLIYILHPLFIILIRGAAKILHLTDLLVNDSPIHFIAVSLSTLIFSYAAVCLYLSWFKKRQKER